MRRTVGISAVAAAALIAPLAYRAMSAELTDKEERQRLSWALARTDNAVEELAAARAHVEPWLAGADSIMLPGESGVRSVRDALQQLYDSIDAQIRADSLAVLPGDSVRGAALWRATCQVCHTGEAAVDLAHFNYPDTTVIRRALPHVDSTSARDILAHVNAVRSPADTASRTTPIFQPGGVPLAGDSAFGVALFGADAWPDTLTAAGLRAKDPRQVQIGFALPAWSSEPDAYDWLPGDTARGMLPPGVRAASPKLDAYYASPSIANAVAAAHQIRIAAHNASDGPCRYPPHGPADLSQFDPLGCFEVARWGASLIYVEGIRSGDVEGAGRAGTPHFWEVGHMVHKGQQFQAAIPDEDRHTAAWIYLGWMWDLATVHATLYGTEPLANAGFPRHAVWFALRTMVARPINGNNAQQNLICHDVEEAARWGHVPWVEEAVEMGYEYLLELFLSGWLPPDRTGCKGAVSRTQTQIGNRVGAAAKTRLQPLADQLTAALSQ